MSRLSPRMLVMVVMAGLCLVLLGVTGWGLVVGRSDEAVENIAAASAPGPIEWPPLPVFTAPPKQSLGDFLARPLFVPTRRPPPPPPPPAAVAPRPAVAAAGPAVVIAPPALPKLTLLGTVMAGDWQGAILRSSAGKVLTVAKGGKIEGWVLSDVRADRIVLETGSNKQELLFPAPQGGTKGAPGGGIREVPPLAPSLGSLSR